MNRRQIPGLSLAVVKNGSVRKIQGYGFANLELKVPTSSETVYQLASITKCFTATAVMQLVDNGKLALDAPISLCLPGMPKTWSEITVKHLLTHTSDIKNYTELPVIAENPQKQFTNDEMLALVTDMPLEFRPGERYGYSNSGYYLLGNDHREGERTELRRVFKQPDIQARRNDLHSGQQLL
jgi:D-alanyl-D-alanine carboxypeptidase